MVILAVIPPEQYPELVQFVHLLCQSPATHCLNTWANDEPDELLQDFRKYANDGELIYIGARKNGRLLGAMGCEFDINIGRGWLHGPHLASEARPELADKLYASLLKELPAAITLLDAYLNLENQAVRTFYRELGFEERQIFTHLYQMLRKDYQPVTVTTAISGITPTQRQSFSQLFSDQFPNTYYTPEQVLKLHGSSHRILVTGEGRAVSGYVIAERSVDGTRGEIQFLGVCRESRGKGLGSQLLSAGIDWLYGDPDTDLVTLTVFDNLTAARKTYEQQGFQLMYSGVGLRKILNT